MEMSKKKLLAITLTLTTFLAIFAVLGPIVVSTEYIDLDDYCWIEGENLDIGFSKYGEMIGYNEDTEIGLGLQYPGYASAADPDLAPDGTYDQTIGTSVDPFCNEEIDVDFWMNGWFIDIKYKTLTALDREIWAFALFSDGSQHGGDWIVMPSVSSTSAVRPLWQEHPPFANPDSTEYAGIVDPIPEKGGRKTNGYCETDPTEIIYNGPRRFVALCKTTIIDIGGGGDLVAIYFTFIFNKAEKNVIVVTDIKMLYVKSPLNIQFGIRGGWDLSPPTYVHFYTDEPVQCWDANNDTDINPIDEGYEFFFEYMEENKHPEKWWDEVPEHELPQYIEGVPWEDSEESMKWFEGQHTYYGPERHTDKTIKDHSYAVAQVIDADAEYVGALAVWPHPEFWSVQNYYPSPYPPPSDIPLTLAPISRMLEWHKWTVEEDPDDVLSDRDNVWVKMEDMEFEPSIPFIIYEHDFKLRVGVMEEYRIESVYVLTEHHDADDADADDPGNEEPWSNGLDVIDSEIQYQLDKIFRYVHDIAVKNVVLSKAIVGQGYSVSINATVENQGNDTETFDVTAYANTMIIDTLVNITHASGDSTTVTFTWDTTGVPIGNYTISVFAIPVLGEMDLADNTYVNGFIAVMIPGDIDGNSKVNHKDLLLLAGAYGSTFGDPYWNPNADLNNDGKVDHKDLLILAGNYGKEIPLDVS
jgi:hypothetical protein